MTAAMDTRKLRLVFIPARKSYSAFASADRNRALDKLRSRNIMTGHARRISLSTSFRESGVLNTPLIESDAYCPSMLLNESVVFVKPPASSEGFRSPAPRLHRRAPTGVTKGTQTRLERTGPERRLCQPRRRLTDVLAKLMRRATSV